MSDKKIYEAISRIMDDIGAIGKDKYNEQQKYNFRGIDDVYNSLQPALIKNHVFCVPAVKDKRREERKTSKGNNIIYTVIDVDYTFICAEDGSQIVVSVCGEGMDSGDKSLNKALSAAFKYACLQLFCIPTEGEMHDSEENSYEIADRKINGNEIQALKRESERVGLTLSAAIEKKGLKAIEDIPLTLYTTWMTTMALRESVPPPSPDEPSDVPNNVEEELPFR